MWSLYRRRRPGAPGWCSSDRSTSPEPPATGIVVAGRSPKRSSGGRSPAAIPSCSPSAWESFSLVVVEAWLAGKPVAGQRPLRADGRALRRSGGGLWFADYGDFEVTVDRLLGDPGSGASSALRGGLRPPALQLARHHRPLRRARRTDRETWPAQGTLGWHPWGERISEPAPPPGSRRSRGPRSTASARLDAIEARAHRAQAPVPGRPVYLGDHTALVATRWGAKMLVDTRDSLLAPWLLLDGLWEANVTGWLQSDPAPRRRLRRRRRQHRVLHPPRRPSGRKGARSWPSRPTRGWPSCCGATWS